MEDSLSKMKRQIICHHLLPFVITKKEEGRRNECKDRAQRENPLFFLSLFLPLLGPFAVLGVPFTEPSGKGEKETAREREGRILS